MEIKRVISNLAHGPLSGIFSCIYQIAATVEYSALKLSWKFSGTKKIDEQDAALMRENVTVIFKSFERQHLAKRLYHNIQKYYPGVKVIIADDSKEALDLKDDYVQVIQLPFNSGLSYGLNRALERVETPYVIRMDDDELITPHTRFHEQLRFLMSHPQVDLVGVLPLSTPYCEPLSIVLRHYHDQSGQIPLNRLKIAHGTRLDESRIVVGKAPNIFIVRTKQMKALGYDDHIRMLDHREFFYRAAGRLVSVVDTKAYVFHDHNHFKPEYQRYRTDTDGDRRYIAMKTYYMEAQLMKQKESGRNTDKKQEEEKV